MTSKETNPVAYARGVLGVEAETARYERDQALAALEYLLAAVDGGTRWEIDAAMHGATVTANLLNKDKP